MLSVFQHNVCLFLRKDLLLKKMSILPPQDVLGLNPPSPLCKFRFSFVLSLGFRSSGLRDNPFPLPHTLPRQLPLRNSSSRWVQIFLEPHLSWLLNARVCSVRTLKDLCAIIFLSWDERRTFLSWMDQSKELGNLHVLEVELKPGYLFKVPLLSQGYQIYNVS